MDWDSFNQFVLQKLPPSERSADIEALLDFIHQQHSEIDLRDQFLSIASHELKTPLTSIYGILQLQERMLRPKNSVYPSPMQEKQHSFLKIVLGQVERMNELIDGLLDVSRIQNRRFKIDPIRTNVSAIAKEAIEFRLIPIAEKEGIKIKAEIQSPLQAWVDPTRFEEVVSNLGMNAIRFSPEGGTVTLRLLEQNGFLMLSVRDQGPELSEEDQKKIFEIFGLANRSSRLGGLGLGLFISKQIAELHGGDVLLTESIPGKGNIIEATFPLNPKT